jgi:hypothetical protein
MSFVSKYLDEIINGVVVDSTDTTRSCFQSPKFGWNRMESVLVRRSLSCFASQIYSLPSLVEAILTALDESIFPD